MIFERKKTEEQARTARPAILFFRIALVQSGVCCRSRASSFASAARLGWANKSLLRHDRDARVLNYHEHVLNKEEILLTSFLVLIRTSCPVKCPYSWIFPPSRCISGHFDRKNVRICTILLRTTGKGRAGTGLFHKPKLFKMPQVAPRSPWLNTHGFGIFTRFCLAAGGKPLPALSLRLAQGLESVFAKSLYRALRGTVQRKNEIWIVPTELWPG